VTVKKEEEKEAETKEDTQQESGKDEKSNALCPSHILFMVTYV
jgi:hypothetical protein